MKVLYRPHGLHPHAEDAAAELGFALRDETLRVDNPTPYFVPGGAGAGDRGDAPGSARNAAGSALATTPRPAAAGGRRTRGEVAFDWIDDNGVSRQERKALQ